MSTAPSEAAAAVCLPGSPFEAGGSEIVHGLQTLLAHLPERPQRVRFIALGASSHEMIHPRLHHVDVAARHAQVVILQIRSNAM